MASSGLPIHLSASPISPPSSRSSISLLPCISSLQCNNTSFGFSNKKPHFFLSSTHLTRAAQEGAPSELIEDSKFVPLNADDPKYGPPALLLLGFRAEEVLQIQQMLKEMDGEFLKIILCTEDMITLSLWEAINTQQSTLEGLKIAESLPRLCFLSGLTGEEMMMFIDAFPEIGLEPAVFAALVPNSGNKPLKEVMEEIMGDHEMLSQKG